MNAGIADIMINVVFLRAVHAAAALILGRMDVPSPRGRKGGESPTHTKLLFVYPPYKYGRIPGVAGHFWEIISSLMGRHGPQTAQRRKLRLPELSGPEKCQI